MEITTVGEYRKAVRAAKRVFSGVRFGVSEKLVRISKSDALWLVKNSAADETAEEHEMYAGTFARWDDDGDLVIG